MNENENEKLTEIAIKAITLYCAVSSCKSEMKLGDPIMAKGFEPLLGIIKELAEADPGTDYTDLFVLAKTCEIEINEAMIARGLFVSNNGKNQEEEN